MKKINVNLFLSFMVILNVLQAQQITVATFNLRYENQRDTGNLWKDRAPIAAALIRFHSFDIFGTQEGLKTQLDDLLKLLPEYESYGRGRDDGQSKGEHSAIFYRKTKYQLLDKGDFWLSETPDQPGFGWDATFNRICSWVKLKDKQKMKEFFVFNVHYDHRANKARIESSKLMINKIKGIAGNNPVILTGDFNGSNQTEWYRYIQQSAILKDVLYQVEHPYINNGSFNGFSNNIADDIIDHVFVTKHFRPLRYGILTDTYKGKFPSDHFPVLADLLFE